MCFWHSIINTPVFVSAMVTFVRTSMSCGPLQTCRLRMSAQTAKKIPITAFELTGWSSIDSVI